MNRDWTSLNGFYLEGSAGGLAFIQSQLSGHVNVGVSAKQTTVSVSYILSINIETLSPKSNHTQGLLSLV